MTHVLHPHHAKLIGFAAGLVALTSLAMPQIARAQSVWMHNGSIMRLEANGNARRFAYLMPRPGMIEAGARPGDVVFEGYRNGQTYQGVAYIYSRACGRSKYAVAGMISDDERMIEVSGQVPLLGDDCQPRAYRRDVLFFELTDP